MQSKYRTLKAATLIVGTSFAAMQPALAIENGGYPRGVAHHHHDARSSGAEYKSQNRYIPYRGGDNDLRYDAAGFR